MSVVVITGAAGLIGSMLRPRLARPGRTLRLLDTKPLEEATRRRMATYVWAGYLAIAVLAVTGGLLWQSFRRQLRLTRLKTDLVAALKAS